MDKADVAHCLKNAKRVREYLEGEERRIPERPRDPALAMAYDEGMRAQAAIFMDLYREANDGRSLD